LPRPASSVNAHTYTVGLYMYAGYKCMSVRRPLIGVCLHMCVHVGPMFYACRPKYVR